MSASASPIAAECLKPCPEQGDATITRGSPGSSSMMKRALSTQVYMHTDERSQSGETSGKYGATYSLYIARVSRSVTVRSSACGELDVSYCSVAILIVGARSPVQGKP